MSLQHSALTPPEGGNEWTLEPGIAGAQTPIEQPNETDVVDESANALQPIEPPPLSDLERVALGLGWTPQDKWRGDPSKWTPAADYIATTGKVLERTKNDLKLTRREIEAQNARLARVEQGFQTQAQQQAQALFEEYEDAKFQAAQKGDTELYRKLTKEQQDVMAKARPAAAAPQAQVSEAQVYAQAEAIMSDPVASRFFEANPVALQDEQAWALMDREMTRVAAAGGSPAAQFKAAEETLRYAYPDQYERAGFNGKIPNNTQTQQQHHSQQQPRAEDGKFQPQPQQRRPAPPMAGASHVARPVAASASAVDRLPADARAFMESQVAAGKVKDAEFWAKSFLGEKVSYTGAKQ